MDERTTQAGAGLVAELNDLLQLDYDAVQAYTVAIESIDTENLRSTLLEFREDHERHITDLTQAIRAQGGVPLELAHIPTGMFKLAVQKVATLGSDREILLAFKANERQSRDKYRRAAERVHSAEIGELLQRNAADEAKHYAWAAETLEAMGAGEDTMIGRAEGMFERTHAAAADAVEGVERRMMESTEGARRSAGRAPERMRQATGSGLERAAGAVDQAGDWVERQDGRMGERAGGAVHGVADSIHGIARSLRTGGAGGIGEQVDRHPIRSAMLALGAGFIVAKLLR